MTTAPPAYVWAHAPRGDTPHLWRRTTCALTTGYWYDPLCGGHLQSRRLEELRVLGTDPHDHPGWPCARCGDSRPARRERNVPA